ncbi:MAG: bifunctional riboflavin kinase/FMN adenylyltransferase [Desulfovibrionaceae bacterium]|nr:bifunctional riboflavin kinase/FMN adenylyltransferase [Desulfovibrionaceae bacterium]
MQIVTNPLKISAPTGGSCVTWGNFDGVHLGHQKLLKHVVSKAHKQGLAAVAITFFPHPLEVLGAPPPIITCMKDKLALMADLGLDLTIVLPFTGKVSKLEPEDFVRHVFTGALNTREIVMGYSSFFGRVRRGSATLLANMGRSLGFKTEQLSPLLAEGSVVSSTRVRKLIAAGDVELASRLLGRNYFIEGTVAKGRGLGRELGFPTLNILPELNILPDWSQGSQMRPGQKKSMAMLPGFGVYSGYTEINNALLPSVLSIGTNPTFEKSHGMLEPVLEVHILDFNQNLYEKKVRIHFQSFLRPMHKFESVNQLKSQIAEDIKQAREVL